MPKEDGIGHGKLGEVRACPRESPGLSLEGLWRAKLELSTCAVLCRGSALPPFSFLQHSVTQSAESEWATLSFSKTYIKH